MNKKLFTIIIFSLLNINTICYYLEFNIFVLIKIRKVFKLCYYNTIYWTRARMNMFKVTCKNNTTFLQGWQSVKKSVNFGLPIHDL